MTRLETQEVGDDEARNLRSWARNKTMKTKIRRARRQDGAKLEYYINLSMTGVESLGRYERDYKYLYKF